MTLDEMIARAYAATYALHTHLRCVRCGEVVHPDYFPYCSERCEQGEQE